MEPWDPLCHPPLIQIRKQESDSEEEGGLGNVTRVVVRPPGHSGKAKRGHLSFDASFEGGNLGRVDFISEFEYDLFIRPDSANPRHRFWFNFVVDNVRCDQRVIFNLVNLSKTKSLYSVGLTPLVRTSSRPKWQRLNGKYIFYHKSPEHRSHYILSFAFLFDREEDVFQFASCFPYSYSRHEAHLAAILRKYNGQDFIKHQVIATTLQNRNLNLISIGNPTNPLSNTIISGPTLPHKKTKVIFIMGRCHPGETPSSFIIQGLIDFLCSSHLIATTLRSTLQLQILPMINPDGVFLGNHKCSLMGYDLNRTWNNISVWAHPSLSAIKSHLLGLVSNNKKIELDMVIDLHAHSSAMGAFIVGNSYDDVYRFERHILFPKLLAHNALDFLVGQTMYNRDPAKAGTARRYLCDILPNTVNVYTLQVSMYGYLQPKTGLVIPYTEDAYYRLGRNLARTIFDYYKATGLIPATIIPPAEPEPSTRLSSKLKRKSKKKRKGGAGSSLAYSNKSSLHLTPLGGVANNSSSDASSEDDESSTSSSSGSVYGSLLGDNYQRNLNSDTLAQKQHKTPSVDAGPRREEGASTSNSSSGGAFVTHNSTKAQMEQQNSTTINKFPKASNTRNNQVFVTTSFKTFDFSCLSHNNDHKKNHGKSLIGRRLKWEMMEKRRELRLFQNKAKKFNHKMRDRNEIRKIGGGGIIVCGKRELVNNKSKHKRIELTHQGQSSSFDYLSDGAGGFSGELKPFLTIIDLSSLIRSLHYNNNNNNTKNISKRESKGRSKGMKKDEEECLLLDKYKRVAKLNKLIRRRKRNGVAWRNGYGTEVSPWEGDDEAYYESDDGANVQLIINGKIAPGLKTCHNNNNNNNNTKAGPGNNSSDNDFVLRYETDSDGYYSAPAPSSLTVQ